MATKTPFSPQYGSTKNVSPGAASATQTIGTTCKTLRVRNTGATNIGYFRTGLASDGTVTASSADMPVSPGEVVYITKPQDHDTVAYISASGTTFTIVAGEGGF